MSPSRLVAVTVNAGKDQRGDARPGDGKAECGRTARAWSPGRAAARARSLSTRERRLHRRRLPIAAPIRRGRGEWQPDRYEHLRLAWTQRHLHPVQRHRRRVRNDPDRLTARPQCNRLRRPPVRCQRPQIQRRDRARVHIPDPAVETRAVRPSVIPLISPRAAVLSAASSEHVPGYEHRPRAAPIGVVDRATILTRVAGECRAGDRDRGRLRRGVAAVVDRPTLTAGRVARERGIGDHDRPAPPNAPSPLLIAPP